MSKIFKFLRCKWYQIIYFKNKYVFFRKIKYNPKRYCGRKTKNILSIDEFLYDSLSKNRPLFYGRIGISECKLLLEYLKKEYKKNINFNQNTKDEIKDKSGMFTNDDNGTKLFCEYQINALRNLTALKVWYIKGEEPLIKRYCEKNMSLVKFDREDNPSLPWEYALKGKKVLVISSFSRSIIKQYENKELLYEDKRRLPDFQLEVEDSVVSFCGETVNYNSWEEALLDTYNRCMTHDFDVAIIGAGSYSLPLGSLLFKQGKKVIVLNSDVQIMFGIYGGRWANSNMIPGLINEHWIRPLEKPPVEAWKADNGAYW